MRRGASALALHTAVLREVPSSSAVALLDTTVAPNDKQTPELLKQRLGLTAARWADRRGPQLCVWAVMTGLLIFVLLLVLGHGHGFQLKRLFAGAVDVPDEENMELKLVQVVFR